MNIVVGYLLFGLSFIAKAQDLTTSKLSLTQTGSDAELIQRQFDVEVKQIAMQRKIQALEQALSKQKQNQKIVAPPPPPEANYRMSPRNIEVIKKDKPNTINNQALQMPVYPPNPWQIAETLRIQSMLQSQQSTLPKN